MITDAESTAEVYGNNHIHYHISCIMDMIGEQCGDKAHVRFISIGGKKVTSKTFMELMNMGNLCLNIDLKLTT